MGCELVIYFFAGSWNENVGSLAIVKNPTNFFDYGAEAMFHKLGFSNIDEYIEMYPGKFLDESETSIMYKNIGAPATSTFVIGGFKVSNMTTITNIHAEYATVIYIKQINRFTQCFGVDSIPFLTPTTEEVLSCEEFSSTPYENLWFCSDWKG